MSSKHNKGKTIWDVIFSLDSSEFPIQRNYLQEPRGSLNPINSQIDSEIDQKTIQYLKDTITDPYDLYAFDFELNYMIRKLADFILYCDVDDAVYREYECDMLAEFVVYLKCFNDKYNIADEDQNELDEMFEMDFNGLTQIRYWYPKQLDKYYEKSSGLQYYHKLIMASSHIIETSEYDWKIKAEAFLRASSIRNYNTADDETLIYLMALNIKNEQQLEEEVKYRWKRYKKQWGDLYFNAKNPFECKLLPNRLRLIHWDKISSLSPFEPQLASECRGTYLYSVENQHFLSPKFLSDYVRVFTLFRTDLDVDPIRYQLKNVINKIYGYLSGKRNCEYNYTLTDVHYLSDMLFAFLRNRFQNDILHDPRESIFVEKARNNIKVNFTNSSANFLSNIPLTTLIALEVHSTYYSRAEGMIPFLHKAKKWLLEQQTPYGYWYDGVINPEYTTVLVLDALKLIDGEQGLSFPIKTQPCYDQEKDYSGKPIMIVHLFTRTLKIGDKEILFNFEQKSGCKAWDFICELMTLKVAKLYTLRIKQGKQNWKQQYDTLRNMFAKQLSIQKPEATKLLKQFIPSDGTTYRFTDYVKIDAGSSMGIRPTHQ